MEQAHVPQLKLFYHSHNLEIKKNWSCITNFNDKWKHQALSKYTEGSCCTLFKTLTHQLPGTEENYQNPSYSTQIQPPEYETSAVTTT
jgi:hypothetical protein